MANDLFTATATFTSTDTLTQVEVGKGKDGVAALRISRVTGHYVDGHLSSRYEPVNQTVILLAHATHTSFIAATQAVWDAIEAILNPPPP